MPPEAGGILKMLRVLWSAQLGFEDNFFERIDDALCIHNERIARIEVLLEERSDCGAQGRIRSTFLHHNESNLFLR